MKEQIKAIIYKHTYHGSISGLPLMIDVEKIADEIEKLYQQEYLNSCIEKATQALSKIKDVDKELAEIRGENNCNNFAFGICLTKDWPCADCNGSNKWEPINE